MKCKPLQGSDQKFDNKKKSESDPANKFLVSVRRERGGKRRVQNRPERKSGRKNKEYYDRRVLFFVLLPPTLLMLVGSLAAG